MCFPSILLVWCYSKHCLHAVIPSMPLACHHRPDVRTECGIWYTKKYNSIRSLKNLIAKEEMGGWGSRLWRLMSVSTLRMKMQAFCGWTLNAQPSTAAALSQQTTVVIWWRMLTVTWGRRENHANNHFVLGTVFSVPVRRVGCVGQGSHSLYRIGENWGAFSMPARIWAKVFESLGIWWS